MPLVVAIIIALGLIINILDVQAMAIVDKLLTAMISKRVKMVNDAESIIWGPKTQPLDVEEHIGIKIENYFMPKPEKFIRSK